MSSRVQAWIYFLSMVSASVRAALSYNTGNLDAALAWGLAAGISIGALGAYLKLIDIEDIISKNNDDLTENK